LKEVTNVHVLPNALDYAGLMDGFITGDQRGVVNMSSSNDHPVMHLWDLGQRDQSTGAIQVEREHLEVVSRSDLIQCFAYVDIVPASLNDVHHLSQNDSGDQKDRIATADGVKGGSRLWT